MIIDYLENCFNLYSSRIAYINNSECISYSELFNVAKTYANSISRQGEGPVIIFGHKESFVVEMMIACLLVNRPYIPVDYYTPKERLLKIINISNASLMVTEKQLDIDSIDVCNPQQLSVFNNRETITQKNDIAYIIFTSGSTGIPKGVPISRKNLSNFIEWINKLDFLRDCKESIVLNTASYSFDLSVADFYYSVFNGHTIKCYDSEFFDYDYLLNLLKDVKIAVMTPSFAKLLIKEKRFNEKELPDFKCIYFCGERLDKTLCFDLKKRFVDLFIINAYGPTEATSAVSAILIDERILSKHNILPVGKMNNLATELVINNNEIILKGDSVSNGYLGVSSESFYKESGKNCFKTGDYGEIKDDLVFVKGRADSQIKYHGHRIELGEIEQSLLMIDGINNAAVITKSNNDCVLRTIAFVETTLDKKYIRERLKEVLPLYMIPDVIKTVEYMPLTENGKINKKELTNNDRY